MATENINIKDLDKFKKQEEQMNQMRTDMMNIIWGGMTLEYFDRLEMQYDYLQELMKKAGMNTLGAALSYVMCDITLEGVRRGIMPEQDECT